MADGNPAFSEQTRTVIGEIERENKGKYEFSISGIIEGSTKATQQQVKMVRDAVDAYFSDAKKSLVGEQARFETELQKADAEYRKMDEVIRNKAVTARVPYIKPTFVDADSQGQEEITIEGYSGAIDLLITKLVSVSNYVADTSGIYDKYTLGSWVFSGQKAYVLTITPPSSPIVAIERSQREIDAALDSLSSKK
ncbi:MAG: hypothetical protein KGH69_01360 [Candidatus Micrarchaeota archaeon]|nr:hypothetical protein [Candidatus Micrarchaeota archaeon]